MEAAGRRLGATRDEGWASVGKWGGQARIRVGMLAVLCGVLTCAGVWLVLV